MSVSFGINLFNNLSPEYIWYLMASTPEFAARYVSFLHIQSYPHDYLQSQLNMGVCLEIIHKFILY